MARPPASKPTKAPQPARFVRKAPDVRKRLLVDAAIACLAKHGMSGFTIANICAEAGISRGLISHHFNGKEALLVAAYAALTADLAPMADASADTARPPAAVLREIVDRSFAEGAYKRSSLKAWLALWGEIAGNAHLYALHRQRYGGYHRHLSRTIAALAAERGRSVDQDRLATMLIAFIDGLWLEWCIDDTRVSAETAIAACRTMLEPHLGPLDEGRG
jgi:AcrR family transcriptional regulator